MRLMKAEKRKMHKKKNETVDNGDNNCNNSGINKNKINSGKCNINNKCDGGDDDKPLSIPTPFDINMKSSLYISIN